MNRVFLNKIDIEASSIDYAEIDKRYDFYLIENCGEKYKPNARIFDDVLIAENVLAVQYTYGPSFILMLKKDRMNDATIAQIIKNAQGEKYDLKKKKLSVPFEKYQHSLIQIMFNALAKSSNKESVSNLGGKLYYFSSKGKKQVYCVEIKLSTGFVLKLDGKTFTKTDKSYGKPEYVLQLNNTLRLRSKADSGNTFYIQSQYKDTRHQTTFLDFSENTRFESSKIGILSKLMEKFHRQYGEFIQLKIKEENDWEKIDVKAATSQKKYHLRKLKQSLKGKKINIVDVINDNASHNFCKQLKTAIECIFTKKEYFLKNDNVLDFTVDFSDKEERDCLTLRIIHSKSYYESTKEEDPYKLFTDRPVQHVTFDDFPKNKKNKGHEAMENDLAESACIVLLNELLVRFDLIANDEKSISLIDWTSYGFKDDWKFCLCEEKEIDRSKKTKENHYYSMLITPNGHFEVKEILQESGSEFSFCDEIFAMNNMNAEIHNKSDEKYSGLIMNSNGEINIIQETPYFMLPSVKEVYSAVKSMEINKKKETLEKMFAGCLDIYYKKNEEESCEYYSVGQIGSGMNSKIERSARIRKIIPHKKSELFFKDVLNTMNVSFVRQGQLTIMPFPFKYLREWIKIKEAN